RHVGAARPGGEPAGAAEDHLAIAAGAEGPELDARALDESQLAVGAAEAREDLAAGVRLEPHPELDPLEGERRAERGHPGTDPERRPAAGRDDQPIRAHFAALAQVEHDLPARAPGIADRSTAPALAARAPELVDAREPLAE